MYDVPTISLTSQGCFGVTTTYAGFTEIEYQYEIRKTVTIIILYVVIDGASFNRAKLDSRWIDLKGIECRGAHYGYLEFPVILEVNDIVGILERLDVYGAGPGTRSLKVTLSTLKKLSFTPTVASRLTRVMASSLATPRKKRVPRPLPRTVMVSRRFSPE